MKAQGFAVASGLLAVALLAAGCNMEADPSPRSSSASSSEETTPASEDSDSPEPATLPTWDARAEKAAERAASEAVTAWARPELSYEQWWAGLSPLVSWQAREKFATVDPALVPATAVTGAASARRGASLFLARVRVPTDAGTLTVLLSRQSADDGWLVEKITEDDR